MLEKDVQAKGRLCSAIFFPMGLLIASDTLQEFVAGECMNRAFQGNRWSP